MQLAARLRHHRVDIADPRIIARTGWTTEELFAGISSAEVRGRFDLVTLLAGVNDQYRGLGAAAYRASFGRLLSAAAGFAKLPSHLIVLSIPDWSVTPFAAGRDRAAIAREVDDFNDVNRSAAASTGAQYVDVTSASRKALDNTELLTADGLHPSAMMYSTWVDLIVPVVQGLLGAAREHDG